MKDANSWINWCHLCECCCNKFLIILYLFITKESPQKEDEGSKNIALKKHQSDMDFDAQVLSPTKLPKHASMYCKLSIFYCVADYFTEKKLYTKFLKILYAFLSWVSNMCFPSCQKCYALISLNYCKIVMSLFQVLAVYLQMCRWFQPLLISPWAHPSLCWSIVSVWHSILQMFSPNQ